MLRRDALMPRYAYVDHRAYDAAVCALCLLFTILSARGIRVTARAQRARRVMPRRSMLSGAPRERYARL